MATRRLTALGLTRAMGGVALLVVGGIHLEQYTIGHYSVVPTIGTLFLLNFIGGTALGLWLLVPVRRGGHRRWHLRADAAAALAGTGLAGGAIVALLISETQPLFGFMEYGYRPEIVIALVSEAAAVLLLSAFLGLAAARMRGVRNAPGPRPLSV